MQHVTGIGGLFFRWKERAVLGEWYNEYLGIDLAPGDYSQEPWSQEAQRRSLPPFPHDKDYFGRADKVRDGSFWSIARWRSAAQMAFATAEAWTHGISPHGRRRSRDSKMAYRP